MIVRVSAGDGEWLSEPAAQQYKRALAEGMPGGCLTDGGRDPQEQAAIFEDRYVPSSGASDKGPFGDRRGPYKGRMWKRVRGAAVAVPGTSRHESGNAIDLAEPARSWLRSRPEYGFVKDRVKGEPWHFEFVASTVTKSAGRSEKSATPVAESDYDMRLIQQAKRGIAVIGPGYFKGLTGEELPVALGLYGSPIVYALEREFDLARSVALNGQVAESADEIAARVVSQLPTTAGVTQADIAAALRGVFSALAQG